MVALKRIAANTVEKRLLKEPGKPNFGIDFYILDAKGRYAGVTMWGEYGNGNQSYGPTYAICDQNGPRSLKCEPLFNERL